MPFSSFFLRSARPPCHPKDLLLVAARVPKDLQCVEEKAGPSLRAPAVRIAQDDTATAFFREKG